MARLKAFAAFQKLADLNSKEFALAPFSNIIAIQKCKRGYQVTFGVDDKWGAKLFGQEPLYGGLLMATKEAYDAAQEEPDIEEAHQ